MDTNEGSAEPFRFAKRRKFYRKRADEDGDTPCAKSPNVTALEDAIEQSTSDSPPPRDEPLLSVAEIIRQRKAAQRKRIGVEFTSALPSSSDAPQSGTTLVQKKEDSVPEDIKSVISRFAPQTGQITEETDKHMMAYIDSELAKRSQQINSTVKSSLDQTFSSNSSLTEPTIHRQPAALGKLHEIDLGPDAKLRNIARTEAAISGDAPDKTPPPKPPKPRIGRNGKPYIPRPRKRRNSTDIARDRLVEEVLRETRLEVYDEPDGASGGEGDDADQAADDRIAEAFRREFLDAINQRKQKTTKAPTAGGKAGGKAVDDKPKGPKLGGSRSARAAMREREEAAAKAAANKGRR